MYVKNVGKKGIVCCLPDGRKQVLVLYVAPIKNRKYCIRSCEFATFEVSPMVITI